MVVIYFHIRCVEKKFFFNHSQNGNNNHSNVRFLLKKIKDGAVNMFLMCVIE